MVRTETQTKNVDVHQNHLPWKQSDQDVNFILPMIQFIQKWRSTSKQHQTKAWMVLLLLGAFQLLHNHLKNLGPGAVAAFLEGAKMNGLT